MSPYELRFEIFRQAQMLADQEYRAKVSMGETTGLEYPSYYYIESLASKINAFVSQDSK